MDLEEAKATVRALVEYFLPAQRSLRGERLRSAYGKVPMPDGRRPGLSFGVLRGESSGNASQARVLVHINRSAGMPITKKFRQIVENWLKQHLGNRFDASDFIFRSVRPLQAFAEPDRQKRSILRGPCFPIGPGSMISVGDNYQGAVGCFAKNDAGVIFALGAAHVLRREGRQNPAVQAVWQPHEHAPNRIAFGTTFQPNKTDWVGDHDIAEIELDPSADCDPGFMPGLTTRLKGVGFAVRGDRVWKHGPGTGTWSGEIVAENVGATVLARTPDAAAPEWIITDAYLVRGNYSSAFASGRDSGGPVFKDDGTLIGLVVAGAPGPEFALVVDVRPFLGNASLTIVCEKSSGSGKG